jgi:phage baseplate assembly protein W
MPEIKEPIFKDIPLSFNAHPVTGLIKALTNREAVKQSVKNIVLTNHYERPYNPFLGGDVLSKLFEPMTPITEYEVTTNIKQALENFEPRADVLEVVVDAKEDLNALEVSITFNIINEIDPVTVNVLLERVR